MELQDQIDREGHLPSRLVDQRERVAVARDLLFRAIRGCAVPENHRLHPIVGSNDALDPVRRFARLYERDVPEPLKHLRRLPTAQLLPPPKGPKRGKRGGVGGIEADGVEIRQGERWQRRRPGLESGLSYWCIYWLSIPH